MSHKFSLVVEVKDGKAVGHAFMKEDANKAVVLFNQLRDSGKEAYLFQHPRADKRSKSEAQHEASVPTKVILSPKVAEVAAKAKPVAKRGNRIEGVSLDITE